MSDASFKVTRYVPHLASSPIAKFQPKPRESDKSVEVQSPISAFTWLANETSVLYQRCTAESSLM